MSGPAFAQRLESEMERDMTATPRGRGRLAFIVTGTIAIVFGLLTIVSGGATLLGGAMAGGLPGVYVPFVVWFNFLAGFAYVAAGLGLWTRQPWAAVLAAAIAGATLLVFVAFGVHVAVGGSYEMRTVAAMTLRSVVWIALAYIARDILGGPGRGAAP